MLVSTIVAPKGCAGVVAEDYAYKGLPRFSRQEEDVVTPVPTSRHLSCDFLVKRLGRVLIAAAGVTKISVLCSVFRVESFQEVQKGPRPLRFQNMQTSSSLNKVLGKCAV